MSQDRYTASARLVTVPPYAPIELTRAHCEHPFRPSRELDHRGGFPRRGGERQCHPLVEAERRPRESGDPVHPLRKRSEPDRDRGRGSRSGPQERRDAALVKDPGQQSRTRAVGSSTSARRTGEFLPTTAGCSPRTQAPILPVPRSQPCVLPMPRSLLLCDRCWSTSAVTAPKDLWTSAPSRSVSSAPSTKVCESSLSVAPTDLTIDQEGTYVPATSEQSVTVAT